LCTANPKDCKNLTFGALSFLLMQLGERVLSSCDVTGLVKNSLSLCVRSAPFITSISRSRYRWAEMQSESVFVRSVIQSTTLYHRAIVTLQLLELTSRGFAVRIRFVTFFLVVVVVVVVVFFGFMSMPILVLAFIAAQPAAAAALSPRVESFAVMRATLSKSDQWHDVQPITSTPRTTTTIAQPIESFENVFETTDDSLATKVQKQKYVEPILSGAQGKKVSGADHVYGVYLHNNALTLASIAPDEMAFRITREPGHTAVTTVEVIHLVKCIPVEVKLRYVEHCYHELPITHGNTSLFLTPRSRIITRTGTQKDCSDLLPTMYKIHGAWFRLTPKPIEVLSPPTIQPLTKPKWYYVSPTSLATSGIYSDEDLNRLRSHIMFPVEKPSMLNTLARGALGGSIQPGTVSITNLLDEDSLNRTAASTGARLWAGFVTFGSASAGIIAIFVIIRVTKLVIDTIIHGYALHSMYGWSMHLLGAVWSSMTHLLLHLG
ncbi:hypothetical protein ALC60_13167, partial [Trachymyrmex zeteki]